MLFDDDFRWGTATSSYQIEGATRTDGRGPSIWDTFAATPGKVVNGDNGDLACDHYNRFKEDIAIMKDLGIQAYRFSLAWSRLFPQGTSVRESRGFDFYNRLTDSLLEAGIEPLVTAYHWDLPQGLQDKGGWANRDIVEIFSDYTASAVDAFGDRINNWVTINEPWCITWLGHLNGIHAPGLRSLDTSIAVAHHTALAHADAVRAMRSVNPSLKIGSALNMTNFRVADETNFEVVEAAALADAQLNRWWLDAQIHGVYPQNLVEFYGSKLDSVLKADDMQKLQVETDFLGINYYNDNFLAVARPSDGPLSQGSPYPFPHRVDGSAPGDLTDMGWPQTPGGLRDLLVRVSQEWPEMKELSITENGAAFDYEPDQSGEVIDVRRADYLDNHIAAVADAIRDGAPVKSYFAWSLLDNFEWAEGYAKRFGIVHVDFKSMKRTPKASARKYSEIIATRGASLLARKY